jgi:NAD(P)-dependent dehydrogenase (short-subunit alcohol dehydrogenase family)
MGKMCEPDAIANAIVFLASDQARFITGQGLVVNGGRGFY